MPRPQDFPFLTPDQQQQMAAPQSPIQDMGLMGAGFVKNQWDQLKGIFGAVTHPVENWTNQIAMAKALAQHLGKQDLPEVIDAKVRSAIPAIGDAVANAGPEQMGYTAANYVSPLSILKNLMGGPLINEMTTYHASPHKFDKFDMSKVGTGEGLQAYGHGLYFAEKPDVAKQYMPDVEQLKVHRDYLKNVVDKGDGGYGPVSTEDRAYALKHLPAVEERIKNASLYKVDIPDEHIANMLDWDKPLSEQPAVFQALKSAKITNDGSATGADIMNALGKDAKASKMLLDAGIPGVKYLDSGSRGVGAGTRNFVLFDDKIPTILSKE